MSFNLSIHARNLTALADRLHKKLISPAGQAGACPILYAFSVVIDIVVIKAMKTFFSYFNFVQVEHRIV